MAGKLEGKVALVTGASSGIGEAAAIALAEAGAAVAVQARRADRLASLVSRIKDLGSRAIAVVGDVSDEAVADQAVAQTIEAFGRLDILVNSAGIIQSGTVENANTAEWRRVMDVNFFGTLYPCRAAIPHMKAQGGGDIVNISSTSGRREQVSGFAAYGPSKRALNSMSQALRLEVGLQGIRVSIIEPGATATEVAENMSDEKFRDAMRAHVHKAGAVQPREVGATIVFIVTQPPECNICEVMIRPTIDVIPL
jgi:NADP-dependent 3-hydroxy acid dehydrogenase YdfG